MQSHTPNSKPSGSPVSVAMATLMERCITKLDQWILHRPARSRMTTSNPRAGVRYVTGDSPAADAAWEQAETAAAALIPQIEAGLRERLPRRFGSVHAPKGPWLEILKMIYCVVRLHRPNLVVETGIGVIGASTTFILQALNDSSCGRLISIDPDRFNEVYNFHVGAGIPRHLAFRHVLVHLDSREGLVQSLREGESVDIFLHDSNHTYRNMSREFSDVWPFLAKDAVLLSDDTVNSSFDDFCARQRLIPLHVRYLSSSFGLAYKLGNCSVSGKIGSPGSVGGILR